MNTSKNEQTILSNDIVAIPNIITVIGVGSGGHRALRHMYKTDIAKRSFMLYSSDTKTFTETSSSLKIQLSEDNLGTENNSEVGQLATEDSFNGIETALLDVNTKMLFIISHVDDMTEIDAVSVITKLAKEMGILSIAMVIIPYKDKSQMEQASGRIEMMSKCVDSLMIFKSKATKELSLSKVYNRLIATIKGFEKIITPSGYINVDFADVKTVLTDGGVVIMGESQTSGGDRAINAVTEALGSIILNNTLVPKNLLLKITYGTDDVTMDEMSQITSHIIDKVGDNPTIIWGVETDLNLGKQLSVTIIATGSKIL